MTQPDFRAELQALLNAAFDEVIEVNDGERYDAAINRARTVLSAAPQQPSDEWIEWLREDHAISKDEAADFANAVRKAVRLYGNQAAPVPVAVAISEEVAELGAWLRANSSGVYRPARRAADLLEQLARYGGQAAPVPVAERPWERDGWCDEQGRCWWGAPRSGPADAGWIHRTPAERLSHQTHSLPHYALPLPEASK